MVIFSLVVQPVNMGKPREDLGVNVRALIDLGLDFVEVLEAVVVLT